MNILNVDIFKLIIAETMFAQKRKILGTSNGYFKEIVTEVS